MEQKVPKVLGVSEAIEHIYQANILLLLLLSFKNCTYYPLTSIPVGSPHLLEVCFTQTLNDNSVFNGITVLISLSMSLSEP